MIEYAGSSGSASSVPSTVFEDAEKDGSRFNELSSMNGKENPFMLHQEMGEMMINSRTIVRINKELEKTLDSLNEYHERFEARSALDSGKSKTSQFCS